MPIYQAKKVVVVGAGGYLAREFRLQAPPALEFYGIDIPTVPTVEGYKAWIKADARDYETVHAALMEIEPDLIASFAGVFGNAPFDILMEINVGIARNILESMSNIRHRKRPRLLLLGSSAEYGRPSSNPIGEEHSAAPINNYGLSKLFQTEVMYYFCRTAGTDALVARVFNVDGPGLSSELAPGRWRKLVDDLPNGAFLDVGNLKAVRDYLPVRCVARELWRVAMLGECGTVYNICSGVPIAMADLLSKIIAESGKEIFPRKSNELYRENEVSVIYGDRSRLDALGTIDI